MVCGCWLHMVLRSLENSQTQALACKQASGTAQPLPPRCFRVAAYDHAYVGPKGSATCSAQLTSGPLPVAGYCTRQPDQPSMARRACLISFTLSSSRIAGSAARPIGSTRPVRYASARPKKTTSMATTAKKLGKPESGRERVDGARELVGDRRAVRRRAERARLEPRDARADL